MDRKGFKPRGQRPAGELKQQPMAGMFKGLRVGPECMDCRGPIDARPGWSVPNPKGSRKHQREGYLHPDCREKAEKRFAERTPGQKVQLKVPCFSDEDIEDIIEGRGNEA